MSLNLRRQKKTKDQAVTFIAPGIAIVCANRIVG